MWSRRFLWIGLSSGAVVAALTLTAIWLVLFVAFLSDSKDPSWTFANMVKLAVPALVIYPVSWYFVIFRRRDYSLYRTLMLVIATFCATSAAVALVMVLVSIYHVVAIFLRAPRAFLTAKGLTMLSILVWAPVASLLVVAIGAAILIVPYLIVATPMALLHRWLLLCAFGSSQLQNPGLTPSVPLVPLR
jgi:hypothetical protein